MADKDNIQFENQTARRPILGFVHIPKTAGSSISSGLRRSYRFSKFHIKSRPSALASRTFDKEGETRSELERRIQELRLNLILYQAYCGTRFLTGHFWNDVRLDELRSMNYLVTTCLRDPVKRWFSAYFYDRYKSNPHARIEQDIDEFLGTERAKAMGSTYVRYIGGMRNDGDYESRAAIENAISMLDSIDLVGFLENLDLFRKQFHTRTGINLKFSHRRRSPAKTELIDKIVNSPDYQRTVKDLCIPDLEVYEIAQSKLHG